MTENDNDQRPEDVTGERTSAFRADFTNEQDAVLARPGHHDGRSSPE